MACSFVVICSIVFFSLYKAAGGVAFNAVLEMVIKNYP